MIEFITAIALTILSDEQDAERLRAVAPDVLTIEYAREHLGAATVAADKHNVDRSIILAIANHETKFRPWLVGREKSGLYSCGVGQVTRLDGNYCDPFTLTSIGGYLESARVLRAFIDACNDDLKCGLTGYAGGFYLIDYCRQFTHRNCGFADEMLALSTRIRGT